MMAKWKFIYAPNINIYRLYGLYQTMLRRVVEGEAKPSITFATTNALAIGRADTIEYVNEPECKKRNIPIGRGLWRSRFTYTHWTPNDTLLIFTYDKADPLTSYDLNGLCKRTFRVIHDSLELTGMNLQKHEVTGRSDFIVDYKKIGGRAFIEYETGLNVIHGLLGKFDLETYKKLCHVPETILRWHKHNIPVASMYDHLGHVPKIDELKQTYLQSCKKYFGHNVREEKLTESELEEIDEKSNYFSDPTFIRESDKNASWYLSDKHVLAESLENAAIADRNLYGEKIDPKEIVY